MDAFFSDKLTTKADCDRFAEKRFGGPVRPVSFQGAFSYTVTAGNGKVIVQFRVRSSPLPDPNAQLFQAFTNAHPGLVALHQRAGAVGALEVYSMPKLQGDTFVQASESFYLKPNRRVVLAEELAKFFVRSLQVAQNSISIGPKERGRIYSACLARLENLWTTLPKFRSAVEHVRNHIDTFFNPHTGYPLVPVHGDLSSLNILVNKTTGNLTGVIDLAELSFLPFGFDFYAVDNIVGEWSPNGWTEFANAAAVRAHFWATLVSLAQLSDAEVQNIKVAWLAGILFRYGTRFDAGFPGMVGLLNDNNSMGTQMLDGLIVDGCCTAAAVPPTTTPDIVVAPPVAAAPANDLPPCSSAGTLAI
ncbi:hypothetical protein F5Y09DRAFT_76636 [Xylaria sp. FL1042]|nr:hypothetical protein F5Y09DRAFT_76636 [Xylaria sp. FL1042]